MLTFSSLPCQGTIMTLTCIDTRHEQRKRSVNVHARPAS
jgi:hypothetical protein